MLDSQLRRQLAPFSSKYSLLSFSVLGIAAPDPDNQNAATTTFRCFVQAQDRNSIAPQRFLRPIIDNIMQGYPGATFHLDFRQGIPKPYFEYYVTLLPQSEVQHTVHFNGRETFIPPPRQTKVFPQRPPSQGQTAVKIDLSKFG